MDKIFIPKNFFSIFFQKMNSGIYFLIGRNSREHLETIIKSCPQSNTLKDPKRHFMKDFGGKIWKKKG